MVLVVVVVDLKADVTSYTIAHKNNSQHNEIINYKETTYDIVYIDKHVQALYERPTGLCEVGKAPSI